MGQKNSIKKQGPSGTSDPTKRGIKSRQQQESQYPAKQKESKPQYPYQLQWDTPFHKLAKQKENKDHNSATEPKSLGIRNEYLKCLPFKDIQTRNATAIILSFYGDKEFVSKLMQCLSHKTRAYFVNADCLKGFLCHSLVSEVLRRN